MRAVVGDRQEKHDQHTAYDRQSTEDQVQDLSWCNGTLAEREAVDYATADDRWAKIAR